MQPDFEYKTLPTIECEKYIIEHGVTLDNFNIHFSIPSQAGLIYTLPNGEFVLVPSHARSTYPGIIFRDRSIFQKYYDKDFFPIDEKDMTWLEVNMENMKHLNINSSFFASPLREILGVGHPARSIQEIEFIYKKVSAYAKDSTINERKRKDIAYCYALYVIEFLMKIKHYKLNLEIHHEVYNPYFLPIIVLPDRTQIDVISVLFVTIGSSNKHSFDKFSSHIGL
jgi:hypothetical protein